MSAGSARVLLVSPDFPPAKGGIQLLMHRLVANATRLRMRVLALGSDGAGNFDATGDLDVRRVWNDRGDRRLAALALNARSIREALEFRPDVILSGHVVGSLGAIALKRLLGVPLVQYVHADEFRVRARVTAAAVRHADAVIAVSSYTRDLALSAGAPRERVHVIPPGVDAAASAGTGREPRPTVLTVATLLFRYKGHDVMLRALPLVRARVPEVQWVVIGDGPFWAAVERGVEAYGLNGSVRLLGKVSDAERDAWLNRAHLFCMPSRLPAAGVGGEGYGIAYLEAAAHGLPAVGGDVAGARDAISDGETGLLVDPCDHLQVADAMTRLLLDRARAERMGYAARRRASRQSWPRIAARVEDLLLELTGAR
jgi:phosphatidylinositol alpha-1,6-mannosyltransferase